MTMTIAWFAVSVAVSTLLLLIAYRKVWLSVIGTKITPTGCGLVLAIELLIAAVVFGMAAPFIAAFSVLAVSTALYWLDDVVQLSARVRLVLSFVTGIVVCAALLWQGDVAEWWLWLGLCLAAGVINVVLTNIVNFYDGADLNLATFIALTAVCLIWFGASNDTLFLAGITALAFIVPFAILNSRPSTLYLGDAGSFAFATLLTIMAIVYVRWNCLPAETFVPAAIPALDTFWVFCIRISERQDLMSRNYLHLYQQLQRRYPPFLYLLPQIINTIVVVAVAALLQRTGLNNFLSVAISVMLITPVLYFSSRKLFIPARAYGEVG